MISILIGCGNNTVVDLGFAVDGSNSIDANEYRLTKDFVKDIIKMFHISRDGTHVALLEYSNRARIKVKFDKFYDTDELLKKVEDLEQVSGTLTNIDSALELTRDMFSKRNAMRVDETVRLIQSKICKKFNFMSVL